jgi:hypothetical protein
MQHTLLPTPERVALRREYHVRVWIIALFAVSVAGTIGVAALFPAYIRGSLEERLQLGAIAALEKDKSASGIGNVEQELAADKILLAALAESSDRELLSTEISNLLALRGTVKLSAISANRKEDESVELTLQGIAPTRESLLSFKARIENLTPGTSVTLPISQLAKSTNIQFSMLIVKPKP